MNLPFDYERITPGAFGGSTAADFDSARVVILPVPLDRTTSYVSRHANRSARDPRRLVAHGVVGRGNRDRRPRHRHLHVAGAAAVVSIDGRGDAEIQRVASELVTRGKFPVVLGGEHSITPPVVAALAAQHKNLSVLQIDAHADLRDSFMGTRHSHGCAMRRTLEHARCTQVGIRSLSAEEAAAIPSLQTTIFYDYNMRQDGQWMDRVVDSLTDDVYITIDCDGFDPAIMPAVGTPEPGGLSWYEGLALLRRVIERRRVVGCDIVELCPMPGNVAPNFLCARLLYKILSYRFG